MNKNLVLIWLLFYRLDEMLRGGLHSNKLTEITGMTGAGKTRFCYKVLLSALAKTTDHVLFIDSGTSFSYERLESYCLVKRMDVEC